VKLLVATGNPGKLSEVREILSGLELELVSLADLGLDAPEEPFETFQENAAAKATASARRARLWTLADDSGLCVDALRGGPGVRSARFAETDDARRRKLLDHLHGVAAVHRGAHFFCAVALSSPDGRRLFRAEGRVDGRIAESPRGSNGFGYDPLFLPDETPGRTLAELASEEKNQLSHRGRALRELRPLLEQLAREGDLAYVLRRSET
jgi:XTP/dITP diphosphohydrolase